MNGIICVDKPQGFTSFDVIAKLRGILKIRRLGHGGTLDPLATGVLPVFVGNATKACDIMPDNSKSYRAGFRLGQVTDTQDITGEILTSSDMPVSRDIVEKTASEFLGDILQIPPMYSAVQINGKRLYELARQGIETERPSRPVHIDDIKIVDYDENTREGTVEIFCGKGTYIRTIINDIGEKIGCGGVMTSLVRTSSCGFTLDECHTIDEIQKCADENCLESIVVPVERVFEKMPEIRLNEAQTKMYRNGVKLDLDRVNGIVPDIADYAVYGSDGFMGTARADRENGILRVGKNLV